MRRKTPEEPAPPAALDRLIAVLLLLPGAVFAWPFVGAPLRSDPYPDSTGTGLLALLILPALLASALRGAKPRTPGLALFFVPLGIAALALLFGGLTDTMEAARAALLLGVAWGALHAGASLGAVGRETLARGLVALSLLWTIVAIAGTFLTDEPQPVGVLGNTGRLSQAALPGAAIGMWMAAKERGAWGVAGAIAAVLFLVHAGLGPVRAGALALAVAGAAGLVRRKQPRLVAFVALAALAFFAGPLLDTREEATTEARVESASEGGANARLLIWDRLANITFDHIALGVGPGQFQAKFPPYRAAEEIELSSRGRALGDVEVEHPHNDWLAGFPEFGFLGGALWMLFLAFVAREGWRRIGELGGLGVGGLALLAGAFFHGPLLRNPASSFVAFTIFGVLLVEPKRRPLAGIRRHVAWLPAAALVIAVPVAASLVVHGAALTERNELLAEYDSEQQTAALDDQRRVMYWAIERNLLEDALGARNDSFPALALAAQHRRGNPDQRGEALEFLDRALLIRPNSPGTLLARGQLLAMAENREGARQSWQRVLELDENHPLALFYLSRFEIEEGRVEAGREHLARLEATGHVEDGMRRQLGATLMLVGEVDQGLEVAAPEDERLLGASPDLVHAIAQERRQLGEERYPDALECAANLMWAREHAAAGRTSDAVRLYRQALNRSSKHIEGGAEAIRLEMDALP